MADFRTIAESLGGQQVMDRLPHTGPELHALIAKGFRSSVLKKIVERNILRKEELGLLLSERTLARRRKQARLTSEESDLMARAARVVLRAREVFADEATADRWLRVPNRALDGATPIGLIKHDSGARLVETALDRIAYGDYS